MRVCLALGRKAWRQGEVPIGSLVVRQKDGYIVGFGCNQSETEQCVTKHAEMQAIEAASMCTGSWRLNSHGSVTLYTTVEPCIMCLGASLLSRVDTVVFGAENHKFGGTKRVLQEDDVALNHSIQVIGGVLEEECADIMTLFFKERRRSNALRRADT